MAKIILLADCADKTHKHDTLLVKELASHDAVKEVLETFVRLGRKEYCIALSIEGDEKQVEGVKATLHKFASLKNIRRVSKDELPFMIR